MVAGDTSAQTRFNVDLQFSREGSACRAQTSFIVGSHRKKRPEQTSDAPEKDRAQDHCLVSFNRHYGIGQATSAEREPDESKC